jgi:RNA 2',3'-cyclic 3'-phosphodiesterase
LPRLFVALRPPDSLVDDIQSMSRPQLAGLRWTRPEQWHVTLDFLGPVATADVGDLEDALQMRLSLCDGPVTARVEGTPQALSAKVWVLPVEGLDHLAAEVRQATGPWRNSDDAGRPFRGHVTLARTARTAPHTLLSRLEGPSISGSWAVCEVDLVSSRTLAEGASYTVIGSWPVGK